MAKDKDGDFIDPELERDRFKFDVEPLTDDDIKTTKGEKSTKAD